MKILNRLNSKRTLTAGVAVLLIILLVGFILIVVKNQEPSDTSSDDNLISATGEPTAAQPTITSEIDSATPIPTVMATNLPETNSIIQAEEYGMDYELYSPDFVDDNNGWVVLSKSNNIGVNYIVNLLHTRDGGVSWEAYETIDCRLEQVSFADSENGWALALMGDSLLSTGDVVTYQLLRTKDSGKSWTVQLTKDANYGDSCEIKAYGDHSACAIIGGNLYHTEDDGINWVACVSPVKDFYAEHIFFNDQGYGWVSGLTITELSQELKGSNSTVINQPKNYELYVFVTRDGAKSWQQQFYEACDNVWSSSLGVSFSDNRNGWLLTCNHDTWEGDLFHTTDGGKEWKKVNRIRVFRPYTHGLEAVTEDSLWIPFHHGAGPIDGGLYYSGDGGETFEFVGAEASTTAADVEITNSNGIDFVTPLLGFAIIDSYPNKYLIKTTDGGKTWRKVTFTYK